MYKKVKDVNFRDYDQKFVLVRKTENFLEDTDIKEPFYAYMYIDRQFGIIMVILGNEENGEKYVHEKYLLNALYERVQDFEIEIIEDEEYEFSDTVRFLYKENREYHEEILQTRNMKKIDKFRVDSHPDIVSCFIMSKSGQYTTVLAKIKGYIEESDVFIVGPLSNEPISVYVKHIIYNNTEILVMFKPDNIQE